MLSVFSRRSGLVLLLYCGVICCAFETKAASEELSQAIAEAQTLYSKFQYFPALRAAQKAETLSAKLKNIDDPRRAKALLLLADTMQATGQLLQSELVYKQAIGAFKRLGKSYEKQLMEAFGKLGMLFDEVGRQYLASSVIRKIYYLEKERLGPGNPDLLETHNRLLQIAHRDNNATSVSDIPREAYAIAIKLPKNSPLFIRTMINLGWFFQDRQYSNEEIGEALKGRLKLISTRDTCEHTERMKDLEKLFNNLSVADKPLYIKSLSAFGAHYVKKGWDFKSKGRRNKQEECWTKAQPYLEDAVRLTAELHGHNHPKLARAHVALGDLNTARAHHADAAKNFENALKILKGRFNRAHRLIGDVMSKLNNAYEKAGQKDKAAAIAAQRKKLPTFYGNFTLTYATTRDWNAEKKAYEQLGKTNELSFGTATVTTSRAIFRRIDRIVEALGETDKSEAPLSYAKDFRLVNVNPGSYSEVGSAIAQSAGEGVRFPDQALLFVHGYNVDHAQALKRAAQIAYDLEFDGALILFSWNSAGSHVWYSGDRERAEAAAEPLFKFLDRMTITLPRKIKIHVIAHSMGNRVLSRAIEKFAQRPPHARFPNLGEIIMAHSDIDLDWCQKMGKAKRFARGITNYVNADDWALWVSSSIRLGEGRCGRVAQSYPGIETVDTTGMGGRSDQTLLGLDTQNHHGVFVNDPILFGDMYRLLSNGRRPVHERTPEFRPVQSSGKSIHWKFEASDR